MKKKPDRFCRAKVWERVTKGAKPVTVLAGKPPGQPPTSLALRRYASHVKDMHQHRRIEHRIKPTHAFHGGKGGSLAGGMGRDTK